jgi:hypothetical protein
MALEKEYGSLYLKQRNFIAMRRLADGNSKRVRDIIASP